MTVSLKHTFTSAKTDSLDTSLVQPSNWNEEHQLTLATNKVLGRATAGTGAAEELSVGTALSVSGGTLAVTNVPVANGGTGAATLTGYVKGNGTSAFTAAASVPVGDISGTLPVANGGTGAATLTANAVLVGNGTSAVTAVAPSTSGNVLTSNGTSWTSATPVSGPAIEFARQFVTQSTANFTVPTGVTNIRLYACGKGGNAIGTAGVDGGGGGGAGFGFGTLAVTAGQVINVTISGGIATVARSAVTLITANPGSDSSGTTGGAAGTATINGVLTSSGNFSGGAGGNTCGGGGSAGSPLGTGFAGGNGIAARGGGGGGIGGVGGAGGSNGGGGGGGAGGAGNASFLASGFKSAGNGGGAGGAASTIFVGTGRAIPFTDPLLAPLTGFGGSGSRYLTSQSDTLTALDGQPGGGGGGGADSNGTNIGNGGFGGGGGGGTNASLTSGFGGALGGGGAGFLGVTAGKSLAGGGAGGGNTIDNTGGPATVWIYY